MKYTYHHKVRNAFKCHIDPKEKEKEKEKERDREREIGRAHV